MDAIKVKLAHLILARRQDGANPTDFQGALNKSLVRNGVLETGNEEDLRVAKASDLRFHQNERELSELKGRLHPARTSLADLQAIDCRCGERERRI